MCGRAEAGALPPQVVVAGGRRLDLELSDVLAPGASGERLALALEAGGMGTWDWDLSSARITWDARTAAIFGIRLEEFDGSFEAFLSLVHPDDVSDLSAAIEQALAARGELRREYRTIRPDGEVRWVSVRGRVLTGPGGQAEALLGVVQDRTDTHSQDEQIARTLESIDEAFFRLGDDWRFTYVNASAERLLKASRSDLVGRVVWDLFPEAAGSVFQEQYQLAALTGAPVAFEAPFEPLDIYVDVRAYPDASGLAVYFRDISARRRAESERRTQALRRERASSAAARMLELMSQIRPDLSTVPTGSAVVDVGLASFGATRVALWEVSGDTATLLAQRGGDPLLSGAVWAVDEMPGLRAAMSADTAVFLPDARDVAASAGRDLAHRVGTHSSVLAPVDFGGRSDALVTVLAWDRVIDPPDPELLEVMLRYAQQAALAVERARRQQAQTEAGRLSAQLQASLLPTPSIRVCAVELGSWYQPGERRMLLGGDFLDVAEHAGRVSMVIGDVTGHGPEAAAIGATLRAGWRMLALRGESPTRLVERLDQLLRTERLTDEQLVSVCCAQLDADGRTMTVALAGHPPPLLVTETATGSVDAPVGPLLGLPVDPDGWSATTLRLPSRWALLMYTDGLTEARMSAGSAERLGVERLAEHVSQHGLLDTAALDPALGQLQRDVRSRAGEPIEDDVALLLVRSRSTRSRGST